MSLSFHYFLPALFPPALRNRGPHAGVQSLLNLSRLTHANLSGTSVTRKGLDSLLAHASTSNLPPQLQLLKSGAVGFQAGSLPRDLQLRENELSGSSDFSVDIATAAVSIAKAFHLLPSLSSVSLFGAHTRSAPSRALSTPLPAPTQLYSTTVVRSIFFFFTSFSSFGWIRE